MEDETEQQQTSDGPQNLNDLQSYLVHFNKEIGSNDGNSFQQKFISQMIAVTASENTTPSEEELPAITGDYLTVTTLWANSADDKLVMLCLFFPRKQFNISCKLSP